VNAAPRPSAPLGDPRELSWEEPNTRPARELESTTLGQPEPPRGSGFGGTRGASGGSGAPTLPPFKGRLLGVFRNTYYDFPSELDYSGPPVTLRDPACRPILDVPRPFFESLCVQGSGTLARGGTVSFAKRDCDCAEVCPRTSQKICFERLDAREFPWGRGATGKPITPLLTIAVDSTLIPLGTAVYVPEYEGLPREPGNPTPHDGCFIAQDRGLRVKGQQIDVFTGSEATTKLWNGLVPSNRGVHVVLDEPKCARASAE
jgi:3D (Asp-Asp-Asp) domain-containing protein